MTELMPLMIFIWAIGWYFSIGLVVPHEPNFHNVLLLFALILTWPIAVGEWIAERVE